MVIFICGKLFAHELPGTRKGRDGGKPLRQLMRFFWRVVKMGEKIEVQQEMLDPVNKIEALAQLLDAVADSPKGLKMDISGLVGMSSLLNGISNEIQEIGERLTKRIQEQEAAA